MKDWASELRAIADGRLMLNVRNGVTVSRSMLTMIADEFEAMSTALAAKDAELAEAVQEIERLKNLVGDPEGTAAHEEAFLARAERAEAQLAEARKALEWHPIETAPLNTIVDLWCTYADAPASWGNDRPAGEIVHNRHKSKEHGWFGNESNDGIPQANGPDLVPVAWRWPAPEIPLEMMERFVAARALEAQGGENG